jgi:hypothetical protein
MNEFPPKVADEAVMEGQVFLMPPVEAVVFFPNTQTGPTVEQEAAAIVNAYLAAARAGQIGVIKCTQPTS